MVQTNQLLQIAATSWPSNHRSGNQVQKGIKGDYLGHPGFFLFGEMKRSSSTACAVWLPSVADSGAALCCGRRREEQQGPKQICFTQCGCLATTAAPYLWLEPSLPLQTSGTLPAISIESLYCTVAVQHPRQHDITQDWCQRFPLLFSTWRVNTEGGGA